MTTLDLDPKPVEQIRSLFLSRWKLPLFMLWKLPIGAFAGLRVGELTQDRCVAEVRYSWITKNPFCSTYMAVLTMAGELASGALVLMLTHKQKPSVATLITGCQAKFHKKATGRTRFVFEEGAKLRAALQRAIETGEGVEIECPARGLDDNDQLVAEFSMTWSFKRR